MSALQESTSKTRHPLTTFANSACPFATVAGGYRFGGKQSDDGSLADALESFRLFIVCVKLRSRFHQLYLWREGKETLLLQTVGKASRAVASSGFFT